MSCGLTLSARQRIVVQREISRLEKTGEDPERLRRLRKGFQYYGNETCAGDGLCSTSCPMRINTSDMIHDIRERLLGKRGKAVGSGPPTIGRSLVGAARNARRRQCCACRDRRQEIVTAMGRGLHRVGIPLWTPPRCPNPSRPNTLQRPRPTHRPRAAWYTSPRASTAPWEPRRRATER